MKRPRLAPSRRGFTLIEVLLVLVILVILASLAVTAYGPIQRKAYIQSAKSQIGLFAPALDTFQLDTGTYPMSESGLMALFQPPGEVAPEKWNGPYIQGGLPMDPWGQPYRYQYPGMRNPNSYDLWSAGPDMVDGTDDDIGNWTY
jgi:general secretion pathway protein G